ncbi:MULTISPECIES: amidohydrolase [Arthrobacter]|uniref:Amidohydrolase n=2 Tax=Arthrobacter TaxID=1663 RepID=A0ABU9KFU3_9MICC|nr:amidohydrolase [Arthrobacter sp. YJM1]MDP5225683.1 amidohydrolase [Arthrobacter sp. YJM1]
MTPAETILLAQTIHTLDPDLPKATAVAISGGRIIRAGDREAILALSGPATTVLDYGQATAVPGLTDSHTHVVLGLDLARGLNLTDVGPLGEVQRRLAEAAARLAGGEWLQGWGLDPNLFTGIGFQGLVFDGATGEVPLFLRMRDGHSAVVNSAAIRQAGITGDEEFSDESLVALGDDGRPTGYLVEFEAMELALAAIPQEPFPVRAARLREILDGMAATGITATHVLDLADDAVALVEELERDGELPVRLRFSPMVQPHLSEDGWAAIAGLQGRSGRRWVIEGVKFLIDGTVDNGTAWLEHPDLYGQGTDPVWTDPEQYRRALGFFASRGVPTATHAIGDQGVRYVLDALEGLGDVRGLAAHRIEHIETIPDDLVPRFAALGVAASMQPVHGTHHTKADRSDNWSVRLGEERAGHGWRCQDLRQAGAILALGSDWPITPYDPRAMMADSMLRRPVERPHWAPVQPEQGLTSLQALEGYTSHAAASAGLSAASGTIAPGKRADFTVFAADPLSVSAEELARTAVVATVLDGREVAEHAAEAATTVP